MAKEKYTRKGDYEPLATNDLTAILDLAISTAEKRRGRSATYPDTPQGLERFVDQSIEFFKYVNAINADESIQRKLIPDVESWTVFLGITRQTLLIYSRRGGEWLETIEGFKNTICACKKQLSFSGKLPPLVTIFDLTNNHHYLNTSTFTAAGNEANSEKKLVTLEELQRRAGLLAENKGE